MTHFIDQNNIIRSEQAGFRKHRSTEDQIIKIQQQVTNGFNSRGKKSKRTLMVLVDFSKAFDTVWRKRLIRKMIDLNFPRCMTKWIHSFLTGRTARVKYDNSYSKRKPLEEGVPQGGVLSPNLFTIYINDMLNELEPDIQASLFADDLAIWTQNEDKSVCKEKLQMALDQLTKWAKDNRMKINESKTEQILFTQWNKEINWNAGLRVNNKIIVSNPNPRFLGVDFDWNLTFTTHVNRIRQDMAKRLKALRAVAHKNWGNQQEDLRALFIGYIRSIADYAGGAWQTVISDSNLEKLEMEQRKAARIITGCFRSTNLDSLMLEADLIPFNHTKNYLAGKAKEKIERDSNNPCYHLTTQASHIKTKKAKAGKTWRSTAEAIQRSSGLQDLPKESIRSNDNLPPWAIIKHNKLSFGTSIPNVTSKKNTNPDILKRYAEEHLRQTGIEEADYVVWTDGSATDGIINGGSGALIKPKKSPPVTIMISAGKYTSSYNAELKALRVALRYLDENIGQNNTCIIALDNQGVIVKIKAGHLRQDDQTSNDIWKLIKQLTDKNNSILLQWIPSHVGIDGNEEVDEIAKSASKLSQAETEIPLKVAKTVLSRQIKKEWEASTTKSRYHRWKRDKPTENKMSRKDRTLLARIRSGHCEVAKEYQHRIGKANTPNCDVCSIPESVHHLLFECPQWMAQRRRHFDSMSATSLDVTGAQIVGFLRGIGRH